jgi:asparagine synthase (glutamine-hydrolysing)
MCGIAGYFGKENFVKDKQNEKKILSIMKFRGPDGNGVYSEQISKSLNIKLFHTRLSIIDPSERSHQPFQDNLGIIVFNGMIYNFKKIKKKLKKKGLRFITNSDTEVLLKFLNHYGIDKIDELDGMWSFAYYSFKKKKFYLCRDRFGEKPLYFYKNSKNIVFGSSVDYILNITNLNHKINKKQIELYLKNGFRSLFYDTQAKSFFKDINTLEPGVYYEIDSKLKIKKKNYWQPKNIKIKKNKSYFSELKNLKDTYKEIVTERTQADFPVACLLSGGIDSSSIACNISKKKNKSIHYFSAFTKDKRYDESNLINKIVKKKKIQHTYVKVEKNNKKNLKIINNIIEKTGNLVPTVSWLLFCYICELIKKKKFKVVLTGTGGDEMFAGYYAHHLHFLQSLKLLKAKNFFKKNFFLWQKYIVPLLRNEKLKDFEFYSKNFKKIDQSKFEYLSINKYFKNYNLKRVFKKKIIQDYFKNELYKELFYSSLPPQIFATDSISMYYNIESRLPLLSNRLYNLSFSYPNHFLIKNAFNKAIFRESQKGLIPNEVLIKREKIGFFKSIDEFFNFRSKQFQNIILENKYVNSFINLPKFKTMLLKKDKTNQECHLIFSVINIVLFLRKYKKYI